MLRRYKLKNYNFRLVILLIAISIIGVLLIGSADSADQKKQAIGVVLGVVIMIIVSLLDYSWLLNFYWVLYIGNLMMLGVLYLGGSTAKNTFGATRWIQIPCLPSTLPSSILPGKVAEKVLWLHAST